jgi:hypothetical protein
MGISLLLSAGIFSLSVGVQVIAIMALVRFLQRRHRLGRLDSSYWFGSGALSGAMLIMFAGHLLQVGLWATLFEWIGEFDDFESAFYHSAVNFSSLGYGDIVMSPKWRLLGAMEASGGILMFGLSTALGFAVIGRIFGLSRSETVQSSEREDNRD